jgi:YtoQ family protein
MIWQIYLSGEIHTDWRDKIISGLREHNIAADFTSPVTEHKASDSAGDLLANHSPNNANNSFWRDHRSARINAIRTKNLIESCDIAVIRFGHQYKQWNAAYDAGYCAALGKPYITLHDEDIIHPLKEIDASAAAWATQPEQVVEILRYTIGKEE